MDGDDQRMVLLVEAQQGQAQQGAALEVERRLPMPDADAPGLHLAPLGR